MVGVLVAILVLGFLIAFHELGHFVFAKLFGVGVTRFSIGFGPVIWSKRVKETKYALSAIPIGGYVKMTDEDSPALEGGVDTAAIAPEKSFALRPTWQKSVIILAGPGFNILLAVICLILLFRIYGIPRPTNIVEAVTKDSPAEEAGIEPGDRIKFLCADPGLVLCTATDTWEGLQSVISKAPGAIYLIIGRDCETHSTCLEKHVITVTPKMITQKNIFGEEYKAQMIGISPHYILHFKSTEAVTVGLAATLWQAQVTALTFYKMVSGSIASSDLGGPILIAQASGDAWKNQGFAGILEFTSFISVNLAILNLLPIPVLDGGNLLMFLIEGVTRKRFPPKAKEIMVRVGVTLLLALMVYATWNDILRLFY